MLWGAEKAGSGSLGQRDLAPPGSFISHLLAVGSSSFIGDRDPGLVDGGREPEKEVVEGTLALLRSNHPEDKKYLVQGRLNGTFTPSLLGGSRTC